MSFVCAILRDVHPKTSRAAFPFVHCGSRSVAESIKRISEKHGQLEGGISRTGDDLSTSLKNGCWEREYWIVYQLLENEYGQMAP